MHSLKKSLLGYYYVVWCYNVVLTLLRQPGKFMGSLKRVQSADFKVYQDGTDRETFWGYYDKSPISPNGEYLILHSSRWRTWWLPSNKRPIELLVKRLSDEDVVFRQSIAAYNWQQGCRPQWVGSASFIYNDFCVERGRYISRLVHLDHGTQREFLFPVYEASRDFSLSLNYRRLAKLRPDYGYRNLPGEVPADCDDGVFILDHHSGEKRLLISLEAILQHTPLSIEHECRKVAHKVNHIMLSPDGKRFVFLYRYFLDSMTCKYDRLFLYDLESHALSLIADTGMISHYSWVDNHSLIVYMRGLDKATDAYYRIELGAANHSVELVLVEWPRELNLGDGHPTQCEDWILTDTYPQGDGAQRLILYNTSTGKQYVWVIPHAMFYQGQSRCDLHPRWAKGGELLFFDSVMSGRRLLYSIELQCLS